MYKKLIILFVLVFLLVSPIAEAALAFPAFPSATGPINPQILISNIFGILWPIFAGFAIIMFIIAGFLFLAAQGDPQKIAKARSMLIWGAIGITVALLSISIPFIINGIIPTS